MNDDQDFSAWNRELGIGATIRARLGATWDQFAPAIVLLGVATVALLATRPGAARAVGSTVAEVAPSIPFGFQLGT